ncbi:MAG: hypothetical protein Q8P81_02185 [Nanoarchaeota archaeon]|nr:hypothetical protein [Nanoarchaeota archaeon]
MSYFPNRLEYGDNASVDAFGRARVSSTESLFDSTMHFNTGSLIWETEKVGAGSSVVYDSNSSSCILNVGTDASDYCLRQSRGYMRYQPGKSLIITNTFVMGSGVGNVSRRVGYFDDNDGIYLEQTGSNVNLIRRTSDSGSPVNNAVSQSSWNLDKLDGTGKSGISLNLTKAQIFCLDLQWLGEGRIRCGFNIDGSLHYVHQFTIANVISTVSMKTANLPIRYEIRSNALSSGGSLTQICSSAMIEGTFEKHGRSFVAATTTGSVAVTSRRPILSIRPKLTFDNITGVVNRMLIVPMDIVLLATSNNAYWELVYSGSLTGAVFSSVNGESSVDFDVAASAISGGISVVGGYIAASATIRAVTQFDIPMSFRYPLVLDKNGANPIPLTVVVTSMNATSNVSSVINWKEFE